jgi:hypothetical protein
LKTHHLILLEAGTVIEVVLSAIAQPGPFVVFGGVRSTDLNC